MSAPLIGLTTYSFTNKSGSPQFAINQAYVRAIEQAGGCPVLIPFGLGVEQLETLLERLDGILFTGGGDIHPRWYQSSEPDLAAEIDPQRDELEIGLVRRLAENGKPFLGICRGLQVINVALGGSLYEDIQQQHPGALDHRHQNGQPRSKLTHQVRLEPGGWLRRLLAEPEVQVNSLHHQGIRSLAPGLRAIGWAPDEIIEAIELPEHPFARAVQWHPEELQHLEPMRRLFVDFVQACQNHP